LPPPSLGNHLSGDLAALAAICLDGGPLPDKWQNVIAVG
jgi:hypothetical protein